MPNDFLTVAQTAERLGIGVSTVYAMLTMHPPMLLGTRVGKRGWRVTPEAIEAYRLAPLQAPTPPTPPAARPVPLQPTPGRRNVMTPIPIDLSLIT